MQALEIVPGRLGFLCGTHGSLEQAQAAHSSAVVFCIDEELEYEPFYSDFGPLNLGHTYSFCMRTLALLEAAGSPQKMVLLYCAPHAHRRANAAALMGIFQTLMLGASPEQAYARLAPAEPFMPFRDPSMCESALDLSVLDIISGMHAAERAGFLPWTRNPSTFDLEAYQHYEQVQNGDLNWIVPGKLLAFAGPTAVPKTDFGFRSFTPEDYWGYFKDTGVSAVVRLNNKLYKAESFQNGGFRHYDLYFPDGSCPTNEITLKFLELCERESGGFAIHCKAGLGRTGVLICCYMMKHYGFTAEQAIAYIRVCRPGSVIGPQQTFLKINESELWRHGDVFRAAQQKAQAKAAESPKPSPAKKRMVIDITASAASMRLPAAPGPFPNATASPLQDAKSARHWSAAALEGGASHGAGPLAAGAAAAAAAEAEAAPPPSPPATRSGGPRMLAALRDLMGGGSSSSGSSAASRAAVAGSRASSRSGASDAASAPGTPPRTAAPVPPVAKASPHFLASNGQPRKGAALRSASLKTSKAARGLDFDAAAGPGRTGDWTISTRQ